MNRLLIYLCRIPHTTFAFSKSILYCILNERPCRTFRYTTQIVFSERLTGETKDKERSVCLGALTWGLMSTWRTAKYRVFQKDLNIFYSGHRGHRTWHPVIFFLWGYVKDSAYKLSLPQNVRELQDRIRAAVQTIDGNMLKRVWQERLSYWHLQSNEGRSHRAFVSWIW